MLSCDPARQLCYFVPLHPEKKHDLIPLKFQLARITGISYDPTERRLYWTDVPGEIISRAFINNGSTEVVVRDLYRLKDIEIDHVARKIYFTDGFHGNIRVSTLDGRSHTVLVNVESPRRIALDSFSG